MLISSGSGKTTIVEELEARLESEIVSQAQEEPGSFSVKPPIVLVKVSLPSLQIPLAGLF
jgi:hypothetical protein